MDIFEQEYTQGLRETAADQFMKLAAAIDGADLMGRTNPTGAPDHPTGVDARSLDEGLSVVERLREGRGKITAVAEKQYPTLKQRLHRDVMPVLSGGIEESDANYADDTSWTKLASVGEERVIGAVSGAIGGALAGAAFGGVGGATAGITSPDNKYGMAGRGAASGAALGAIQGAIGGAIAGAVAPTHPAVASVVARGSNVGSLLLGARTGQRLNKSASKASIVVNVPENLSKKEKAGLVTAGSVLGVGGLGTGAYAIHKSRKAGEEARTLGTRAIQQATDAGKNVAEQARVIGDKVSQAADSLSEASGRVSKAVEPAVRAVDAGREAKERVSAGVGRVKDAVTDAAAHVKEPVGRVRQVAADVAERGGRAKDAVADSVEYLKTPVRNIIRRVITKRGSDDSPAALMMKVAAEGKVRTLAGWSKTAGEKEDYVRQAGQEAGRQGAVVGGALGGSGGMLAGASIGARKGRSVRGALIGGIGGAALGATGGGLGLKALSEHNAKKSSPEQRQAVRKFNRAHEQFQSGALNRDQYTNATTKFLRSQGVN